ncbi:MAG: FtsX-like permease family protein [Fidelibacterota bacterium]
MKFAYTIARRFMLGGKGAGPSRLTGWISIIGLAAGTFALIVSLSVLNGFEERVTGRIVGFEGDLRITAVEEDLNLSLMMNTIKRDQFAADAMPYRERKGLISGSDQEQRLVMLKAIEIERFSEFYNINIKETVVKPETPSIYIGQVLAQRLNIAVGDNIQMMSPVDHSGQIGLPRKYSGTISGIFKTEVLDLDDRMVFIPMELGETLFSRKKSIDGIDIRLNDSEQAGELKKYYRKKLPGGILIKSWADLHSGLFNAMRMERLGALAVLSLIILVACFNLMSTLVLVTYQKIREIGILRTLGTTARKIQGVILFQGLMIGGVGAMTGILLSTGLVLVQNQFGLIPLPQEVYFIDQLPMVLKMMDLFVVFVISFILILMSSAIASNRALKINPKEAVYLEK